MPYRSHMEKLSTVFIFSAIKYITIVKQITPRPAVEDFFQCMPNMPSSSLSMGESWKRADVKNVETGLNNFLAEKIFWSLFRDTFFGRFCPYHKLKQGEALSTQWSSSCLSSRHLRFDSIGIFKNRKCPINISIHIYTIWH